MQAYPHIYKARAESRPGETVFLNSDGLETLPSAAPAEFGGPGDKWSPETLLIAAIADCFVLTFVAISRASKLEWNKLDCSVEGVLDRVENITRFTEFRIQAKLEIPAGTDEAKSRHILEKSESVCLITNSLSGSKSLETEISVSQ
jgi:organic hydroperoxide reductase OsmC/OhrA